MELLEQGQRRPQKLSEGWNTSAVMKGWESWHCSDWRRGKALGRPYRSLPVPKGAYKTAGEGLLTRASSDRTRDNVIKMKEGGFRLDRRKKFFSLRVVRHWHRLPRGGVDYPSLTVSKARLDGALSNLI